MSNYKPPLYSDLGTKERARQDQGIVVEPFQYLDSGKTQQTRSRAKFADSLEHIKETSKILTSRMYDAAITYRRHVHSSGRVPCETSSIANLDRVSGGGYGREDRVIIQEGYERKMKEAEATLSEAERVTVYGIVIDDAPLTKITQKRRNFCNGLNILADHYKIIG